jgi:putative ABC transport system permease protein
VVKLIPLIFRNLLRNFRRTALTVVSLAVPFALLMTLQTALDSLDSHLARADRNLRLVVFHKQGLVFDLPESYVPKLAHIPGVVSVCPFTWYGGIYRTPKEMFSTLSVDPETFRVVWPEGQLTDEALAAFKRDRTAALVDTRVAAKFNWKAGDEVTLKGTVRPIDLKFKICGTITDSVDPNGFYFHRAYMEEAMGRPGILSDVWVLVDHASNLQPVIKAAEDMFRNSSYEVKAELEKGFVAAFISMQGDIRGLVAWIGTMVVCIIMLVAANSIAMSVRERTSEVAVMKALGFTRGTIIGLILVESGLMGLAAGILGCWGGYFFFSSPHCMSLLGSASGLFTAPLMAACRWTGVAPLVGMAAGFVPAYLASRLKVVDALRRLA